MQNTGYRPPKAPDPRNFVLEKAQPVLPFPASYKTDLSALGVYDQEKIPDCVENAITKARQYHEYQATGAALNLCRRFLAYFTVKDDGFPISYGTSVENALKRAKNTGICDASLFPDNHSLDEVTFSTVAPSQAAIDNAGTHKIQSYAFLSDFSAAGLKNAIYQNGIVIVGLKLDKNWWTDRAGDVTWDAGKILPLRIPTDAASESGHAIILYAYDEQYFYCWNSFGVEWGQAGHGWFAADYLPFIYEAATIVDLTAEQIAQAKRANQIVDTIDQLQKVETPQNKGTVADIISQLWSLFISLFQPPAGVAGSSLIPQNGGVSGYKTYILAGLAVVYGVIGLIIGQLTPEQAGTIIWGGLTAAALRRGISTSQK